MFFKHLLCSRCVVCPSKLPIFPHFYFLDIFQFGEPLGSFRDVGRFGLHCCLAQSLTVSRYCGSKLSDSKSVSIQSDKDDMSGPEDLTQVDPGQVLNISMRKQKKDNDSEEDLYRTVLVNNTLKAAQHEIKKNIMQSLFF